MLNPTVVEFDEECNYINSRRNLPLCPSGAERLLYSYNSNLAWKEIEQLYQEHIGSSPESPQKNKLPDLEELNMEDFEDLGDDEFAEINNMGGRLELVHRESTNEILKPGLEALDYDDLEQFLEDVGDPMIDDDIHSLT